MSYVKLDKVEHFFVSFEKKHLMRVANSVKKKIDYFISNLHSTIIITPTIVMVFLFISFQLNFSILIFHCASRIIPIPIQPRRFKEGGMSVLNVNKIQKLYLKYMFGLKPKWYYATAILPMFWFLS